MDEQTVLTLMKSFRVGTLQVVDQLKKNGLLDRVDVIPEGFNNNIRWNLGHVAVTFEHFVYSAAGKKPLLSKEYFDSFKNGTSPADWTDETPSLDDIVSVLKQQVDQVKEKYSGKLFDPLEEPFKFLGMEFKTLASLIAFAYYHEGLHTGTIKEMSRLI